MTDWLDSIDYGRHTGRADTLRAPLETAQYCSPSLISEFTLNIPVIRLSRLSRSSLSEFFHQGNGRCEWQRNAKMRLYSLASGADRAYAELALQQATHVLPDAPRIYNAPDGGIILETRCNDGILTLLIEGTVGLLSRSADDFQVTAQFHLTANSVNEMLARYVHELKLLQAVTKK